ncbi:MAG: cytochrome c-type biogenesis protein CcmH [Alphaproteobacteria bacterium]|nr:cytochrome c-type biogenesis protein CcmH [Alphaproteobacteria bacterium]
MRPALAILALLLALAAPAAAFDPREALPDPALETRARGLSAQLRCLVCQNQSIDDSAADLAKDMRRVVRERLTAGDSDGQVIAYLQQRYGDFVLLKPPMKPETWLLWFGPLLVLLAAAGGLWIAWRRRRAVPAAGPVPLSAEERRRLAELTADR